MVENDMTNALKHPHPDVPFATVGDDTITAFHNWQQFSKISFKSP
jgi:hypothetical protein